MIRVFGGFVFRVKGACFGGGLFGLPLKDMLVVVLMLRARIKVEHTLRL